MGFELWGQRERLFPSSSLFHDETDLFSIKMHVSAENSSHRPSWPGVSHVLVVNEHLRAQMVGVAMERACQAHFHSTRGFLCSTIYDAV